MKIFLEKLKDKICLFGARLTVILFFAYTLGVLLIKDIDVTYGFFMWIVIFVMKICVLKKLDMLRFCNSSTYNKIVFLEFIPIFLLFPVLFAFCEITVDDMKNFSNINILVKAIRGSLLMAVLFSFYNGYTKKLKKKIQIIIGVCTIIWLGLVGVSFVLNKKLLSVISILFIHSIICYLAIFIGSLQGDSPIREKRIDGVNYRCICDSGIKKGSPTKIYRECFNNLYIPVSKYRIFSFRESERWKNLRNKLASSRDISNNALFIISNFNDNGVFRLWALAHDKTKKCINWYFISDVIFAGMFYLTVLHIKEEAAWYVAIPTIVFLHFMMRIIYYLVIRVRLYKEKEALIQAIICIILITYIYMIIDLSIIWIIMITIVCVLDFLMKLYKCRIATLELQPNVKYIYFTYNM